jgi:exopolyphosphatase/guanosine-5'-triphosphate,3'-diphosphate pyrophosphatase
MTKQSRFFTRGDIHFRFPFMTIAVIDIGTNTVLLLIARIDKSGQIETNVYEQRVPRLGKGVDAERNLASDSIQRVIDVLKEYKAITARFTLDKTVVAGTSAVRDARNKAELADRIKRELGFDLEVLSGEDEALWTYRGAISGMPEVQKATVVDIGGGSTEIIVGGGSSINSKISLNVGSVRLTERFFKHDPPTHPEMEAAITWVEDELAKPKDFDFAGTTLVGTAGTATSLAILDQGLREFSIHAIMNYRLKLENVHALFRRLRSMSSLEILSLSAVMEGRSDVISAGVLILREIMAHYKFNELIVSERGVRYGLAIREWEKS